jgi:hypothetical protein
MAVNVYSTGNQLSENYSRQDLVDWANSFLHLSFTKVENFCSGGVLCLLFMLVWPAQTHAGSAYLQFCDAAFPGGSDSLSPCAGFGSQGRRHPRVQGQV